MRWYPSNNLNARQCCRACTQNDQAVTRTCRALQACVPHGTCASRQVINPAYDSDIQSFSKGVVLGVQCGKHQCGTAFRMPSSELAGLEKAHTRDPLRALQSGVACTPLAARWPSATCMYRKCIFYCAGPRKQLPHGAYASEHHAWSVPSAVIALHQARACTVLRHDAPAAHDQHTEAHTCTSLATCGACGSCRV